MATQTLWSVNALAIELEIDRRTVAKRLANVPPAGMKSGHPAWRLADAVEAITGKGQRPPAKAEAPQPPEGFAWLAGLPPHDAIAALALMLLAYRLPPVLASLAVASGADCKAAFATSEAGKVAALQLVGQVARDCGLRPWTVEESPDVATLEHFAQVNWPALADAAGEPLDLEAWQAWMVERFAA